MGLNKSKLKPLAKYEDDRTRNDGLPVCESDVKEFKRVHTDRVTAVAVYKSGLCLSGGTDTNLGLFNFKDGKLFARWRAHEKDVTKVCCGSLQGQSMIFSSSRDRLVKSWIIYENSTVQLQCVYRGHELVVTGIDENSDCSTLCSGSRDNHIKLWDVETAQCTRTNTVTRNLITCVRWFPDDRLIAQTAEDKMLRLWDVRSLEPAFTFPPKQYFATCCDVSQDGHFILTSSNGFNGSGCEMILWDVRAKKQIYTYLGHRETVSSCSFLPRFTEISSWPLIISVSHDAMVKVWNQETQKCLATESLLGSGPLTDVAVWENRRICVSTSNNGIYEMILMGNDEVGVQIDCQSHF